MPGLGDRQWTATSAGNPDQARLLTKVAWLYHERGIRQSQIAEDLHISQARVSRLLRRAADVGIVRVSVVTPRGVFTELEQVLQQRFGLQEIVVADTRPEAGDAELMSALGAAAASYLEMTLIGGDTIGISSWSSTLLATVGTMRPRPSLHADAVVQVLGDFGMVGSQSSGARLTGELAQVTGARPVYLSAPGLIASSSIRTALSRDPNIAEVLAQYRKLTVLLIGIGTLEPSVLLPQSGNLITAAELDQLRAAGAVGDLCLRFFNAEGRMVASPLDQRVVGITPKEMRAVPRTIAVAGGGRKFSAIRGALRGGWMDVLVTDLQTAERLEAED